MEPVDDKNSPRAPEAVAEKVRSELGEVERHVIDIVARDVIPSTDARETVEDERRLRGQRFYSDLIYALTRIRFDESKANDLWNQLITHKWGMSERMGRNVGIRVAALDFFHNVMGDLRSMEIIESAKLIETASLAVTDGLTGLFNHRQFHEHLGRTLQQAEENGKSVCLCILDIDHFKKYNDINGHIAGDTALREVARILVDSSSGHFVARYGGEEFGVVMYGLTREEGWDIAEEMRVRVAKHAFPNEMVLPGGKLTLSAGLAEFPRDAFLPGELIEMADRALYVAKREGRNRVSSEVSDRRRQNRLRVNIQIEVETSPGVFTPCRMVNLSAAGCSFFCKASLHAGDIVNLRLFDEMGSNEILVTGKVVWLRAQEEEWPSLIGVSFPLVDNEILPSLRQFLLASPEPS